MITRLSIDQIPRLPAPRTTWPAAAKFDAWSPVDGARTDVNFVGRPATERHAWAMSVVLRSEREDLATEVGAAQGNSDSSSALGYQCEDEAIDDCEAAMQADGAVAEWLKPEPLDCIPKRCAVEDAIAITDDVLGFGTH